MNLIQVIVKLLCQTKMYIAFPKIAERLLELMTNHPTDLSDDKLFEVIEEITSGQFGKLPFVPTEPGGFILTKEIATNQWDLVILPAEVNLKTHDVYGQFGNQHSIKILTSEEIIALTMAKVSGDRVYTSDPSDVPQDSKARSIVYENIMNDNITVTTKNVNLTFFNCRLLTINLNECPVGGIKLVKCNDCHVKINNCDKSPVVPIYAFYCADCKVQLPKDYDGSIKQEVFGCMDFYIS